MAFWSEFIVIVAVISSIKAVFGSGLCPSRLSVKCHSRLIVECSCPPKWQLWGKACYQLSETPATWDDSQSDCQAMGGKMAAPRSQGEMTFMVELARNVDLKFYAWIACDDKVVEGSWDCDGQEGSEPFLAWHQGEPNNSGGQQDCAQIGQGGMDDVSCDLSSRAFCVRQAACTHGLIQLRH
ncbi:C-type lectin domain family 4 member M-like [Patiria miniata]|uniref:C-type lectin domain-containing protein n=1 Tax=Patiria miniata TaxID=46514 RepID=A0A914ASL0_PATMI|nr:C-type lectin domain family 4 member M-like [Patiria miniata]XP_038066754.1 C-type lectin domain family 4 member M-like [Patiria miniata]XP_038066757.1 C-type lectin domain family 4 member M-like [Patiria miniata]